jgi:hypothetical protein
VGDGRKIHKICWLAPHISRYTRMIGPKEESHLRGGCPSLHEERPLLQRRWTSKSPHHKGWYRTSEEESSSAGVVVRIHGVDVVKPGRKSTELSTRATKKYALTVLMIHRLCTLMLAYISTSFQPSIDAEKSVVSQFTGIVLARSIFRGRISVPGAHHELSSA